MAHSCHYHSIVISDHAPVSVDINFPNRAPPFRQWRLNSSLLAQAFFLQSSLVTRSLYFLSPMIPQRFPDALYGKLSRHLCVGKSYHMLQI